MTKKATSIFLKILIVLLLCASWLPHLFGNIWFVELFSHFKVQYTMLLTVLLALYAFRKKLAATATLVLITLVFNLTFIYPFYLKPKTNTTKDNKLKLLSINLFSSNTDSKKVIAYIKEQNPDFLVLLELTLEWASLLGEYKEQFPYFKVLPRNDNFGIAVFSKLKIDSKIKFLGPTATPSIITNLTAKKTALTIIAAHPVPPLGSAQLMSRNKQFIEIAKNRSSFSKHLIVIGDLNCSSFSSSFNTFLENSELKDSRAGFGLLPTWHTSMPFAQTTLDHCLVSKNITVLKRATGPNIGSNHLPISILIEF